MNKIKSLILSVIIFIVSSSIYYTQFRNIQFNSSEYWLDVVMVSTINAIFVWIIIHYLTIKRIKNYDIKPQDYNFDVEQSVLLKDNEWNTIVNTIKTLGFNCVKEDNEKLYFQGKVNLWSWGHKIELDKNNRKLVVKPRYPITIFDFGESKILTQKILSSIPN